MGFLSTYLISILFFLFCSSSSLAATNKTSSVHKPQCRPDEHSALLSLKSSFSTGPSLLRCYDHLSTWNESVNCCSWGGITCDGVTGHVIGLDLFCNGLKGNIISNSTLFFLRHLQTLDLSSNDFNRSPIAPQFGLFSNMTHLNLSYSNFTGLIPFEISHLQKLVSLKIGQYSEGKTNIETITFKEITQNLTNLRELRLSGTNLSFIPRIYLNNLSSSLTFLDLSFCSLQGELPESIFQLRNIQDLDLLGNDHLNGSFPNSNWSTPLQSLDLSSTQISIDLPYLLNSGRSLSRLFLNHCKFVGSYPLHRANLSQINVLFLRNNMLNGKIPWSSFGVNTIQALDLSFNNFTGQFSEDSSNSTRKFRKMSRLWLSDNLLEGPISSWIYGLPKLQFLELENNEFTGDYIANNEFRIMFNDFTRLLSNNLSFELSCAGNFELDSLSSIKKLIYLNLSGNKLSLRFNDSINRNFDYLQFLYLSSCNISEFPNFVRFTKILKSLDLSHNFLTVIEPKLLLNRLQVLDLRFNLLSGQLPALSHSSLLTSLLLSENRFSGPIPTSYCNFTYLQELDLSSNNLTDEIPSCLINLGENLTVIDLQMNKLHGNIPQIFSTKTNLKSLNLNGNLLEGPLPTSLATCKNLELLDLGNNMLTGSFPDWLESLTNLRVLVLRSNNFQGSIPNPKSNFSFLELRILDLSTNSFSGALPTKLFENFNAMMKAEKVKMTYMGSHYHPDSVLVTIKGVPTVLFKIQNLLAIIDFSGNNFTGDIPDFIGNLRSLKGLNFSHNQLKGTIPSSLGNLTNLEWLDFSYNELIGTIPVELVDLKWLQILRLSNNELEGPIPRGKQFDTFNSDSYAGNLGLCGFPLSKACGNTNAQQGSGDDGGHENRIVLDWKVVTMGFASGLVIGLSIGYMVLFGPTFDYWFKKRFGRERRHVTTAPIRT